MSKGKVMVAMSGGVDSSVAAAVLKGEGYEVVGVTLQIWPESKKEGGENLCCSLSAVEDARRVADTLGIPYYVLNFKDLFEKKVIDYFTLEYLEGRTPNPCIACNRYIKFEELLRKALSIGMDYIATGHYARIEFDQSAGRYLLKKALDPRKDQTYVLYGLSQLQLSKTLFPLGSFTKTQARQLAAQLGLPVASKPESQEICFVEDNDYGSFITGRVGREAKPGKFVDTKGKVLGTHRGIIHYTVGQRKGLGLSLGKPMYVVKIDPKSNRVVLGSQDEVFSKSLTASDLNFISIERLEGPIRVKAKIRYSAREEDATVTPLDSGKVQVTFDRPVRAITPGQSVVFYNGDTVVGGGIIDM